MAIFLPLVAAISLISADSKIISSDVTTAIQDLETQFTENIAMAAENLVGTSSEEMDKLAQYNWERLSFHLAGQVADFLYDRDNDLRFLAGALTAQDDPKTLIDIFRQSKTRPLTIAPQYRFDHDSQQWVALARPAAITPAARAAQNRENSNNFSSSIPPFRPRDMAPIYREITILDLEGNEIVTSSDLGATGGSTKGPTKGNVTNRLDTFAKAEVYFDQLTNLKPGEIYVSDVIGAYQPTHMIGTYTADRAAKAEMEFAPGESADAGLENPQGRRFEGIIRYATPLTRNGRITGYLTMAVDHRHIMEFTDYIVPENTAQTGTDDNTVMQRQSLLAPIKDASHGNYAFMWDHEGRNIAHPREYFISGFDPATGERVPGWVSADQAAAFRLSGEDDFSTWLAAQPPFTGQTRTKTPNPAQIKSGRIPLDCRYLDFAPQCAGWHQINSNGGYGSFLIYWSGIWKLTTAATIPYYTGQYADSRRGFGVVTIGANIGEFTRAGMAARDTLNTSLGQVNASISASLRKVATDTSTVLMKFQNQLIIVGALMLIGVVAITAFASVNISRRVNALLTKAAEFSAGDLTARVNDRRKDELGRIGQSFDVMADTIASSQDELADINTNLEKMVAQRTEELRESNQQISDSIDYASRIQRSLLPDATALKASLGESAIIWQPKDVVGGDFYWHKTIGDRDYLVVMDCTGHGVPGAFMTLIATSTLEQISAAVMASLGRWVITPDLSDLMQQLHDGICAQLHQVGGGSESNDGLDATMIAIPHDGSPIEYCGAQMDIFTVTTDQTVTRYRGGKTSLGYLNDGVPLNLPVHQLPLEDGLSFVITTDGITTQIGEDKRVSYGYKRLATCIEDAEDNSPKMINRAIMRNFRNWQGSEERRDDVTLISFRPQRQFSGRSPE
ncbi:MAG: SpoIIE family protein phosphatase [Alphaproteobacteria bacterium]|nr:SpoIIE family protein phosphatase [Alphaproteobacteria bacterium]